MPQLLPPPETPGTALEREAYPDLDDATIDLIREWGAERNVAAGELLFEVGQADYDFIYIVAGAVRVIDRDENRVVSIIPSAGFVGELSLLTDQAVFMACEADEDSTLILIHQDKIRELIAFVPEFADVFVPAFAARRRLLIENELGGCTLVGASDDPNTSSLLTFLSRNRIAHRFIDRSDLEAIRKLGRGNDLPDHGTVVIGARSDILRDPTLRELADFLGLTVTTYLNEVFDLAVIGAGPGGLAAAVFGASEGLSTFIVDDMAIGGQAGTSSRIENYLGFSTGISGTELAYQGMIQAIKFGAKMAVPRRVIDLRPSPAKTEDDQPVWELRLDDQTVVRSRAVVLANGVQYRRLPIPRLDEFEGAGIYYAATELESRTCRNATAVVVGGGNSAGQAAMFLSRHARQTFLVVRRNGLTQTMSSYLSKRIQADDRVDVLLESEIVELRGENSLETIVVKNNRTGEETVIATRAVFIMAGSEPNTEWLKDMVSLDDHGFVSTHKADSPYATSAAGIFSVGDVRSGSVKRVASAVGEGSVVISSVHRYLSQI